MVLKIIEEFFIVEEAALFMTALDNNYFRYI